jgi:endogenous inhibitor of DNA gyrase (YacG/DUF329 family)
MTTISLRRILVCHVCGRHFIARHAQAKFCTPSCKAIGKPKRKHADHVVYTLECKVCGGFFIAKNRAAMYCSHRCNKRSENARAKSRRIT